MYGIILPDNGEVSFKYDSLGRRIEKKAVTGEEETKETKTTRFVWDGNTPIHEWVETKTESENENANKLENLVTWVFNDGFVPNAKITNEGNYSIISDYLGTPVEAYDTNGNKVWGAELDIYGRVKTTEGNPDFIPFRYQGQYHDTETDLYYNRFRYYSPSDGIYTQQDPIGLAGGNPTLYAYVHNPHAWIDPFGLQRVNPGEDLYVGTYSSSYRANVRTGLNKTHTPHHATQDAINKSNDISHSSGITINMRKDLHGKTRTYRKPMDKSLETPMEHLLADIDDIREILLNANYDAEFVNEQLEELKKQNIDSGQVCSKRG